jgi:hypothetical protein
MKFNTLVAATAVCLSSAMAQAGIYSGPSDTSNAIDPAILSNSPLFVEWANTIDAGRTRFAPRGSSTISTSGVNSLGDLDATEIGQGVSPGYLTVTFPHGVRNGSGADFAVFENGFAFGSPDGLFAEFAYVEVSTDGTNFARFPSISTNVAPVQGSGAFAGFDVSNVFNLAGKHATGFGTPFDLTQLLANPQVIGGLVDLANIQFVKLVDIPGNGAFKDSLGKGIGVLNAVPEPTTLLPLLMALMAVASRCRRRLSF